MSTTALANVGGIHQGVSLVLTGSPPHNSSTTTNRALSTAYTYGSAGGSVCQWFQCYETGDLTEIAVFAHSYTGTWGSTDGAIDVEVREGWNGAGIPGTTLVGSFTITMDGTALKWNTKTGAAITLTAGKFYCLVICDKDANGTTDYCTLRATWGNGRVGPLLTLGAYDHASGWSSAGSVLGEPLAAAWKVGNVWYGGMATDNIATVTSNTLARGNFFTVPEDMVLCGARNVTDTTMLCDAWTYKLYNYSQVPSDTPLLSYTPPTTARGGSTALLDALGFPASSHINLTAGNQYRFVCIPPSAITTPRKASMVTTGISTTVRTGVRGPFNWGYCIEVSGGASWSDDADAYCQMVPLLATKTAVAAGSALVAAFGG